MNTANERTASQKIGVRLVREKLVLLTKLRVLLITVLYFSALVVSLLTPGSLPIVEITILAIGSELVSIALYLVYRRMEKFTYAVICQLVLETTVMIAAIRLTGGAGSPFLWMLALVVLTASLVFGATTGYVSAGAASFLVAGQIYFDRLTGAPARVRLDAGGSVASVVSNIALYSIVALIAGFMAERFSTAIRRSDDRSRILAKISITDDLTGLYNQRYFVERLEQEVARANREEKPLSVAFFDLDNFKEINDTFGHQVGDELLRDAASIIAGTVRRGVDTAFRYGGDEMVVILGGADIDQGMAVVGRIREAVASMKKRLTLSVGIAEYVPGRSADEFLGAADHAMYEAKATGGNAVIASDWEIILAGGT
ncbi:MAG: GGDEF domain-containing protein [Candidatus Aquicultorales bacterium]